MESDNQDGLSANMAGPTAEAGYLLTALDGNPIATFVIDCRRNVVYWNRACERLTGVGRDRVLGRPLDSSIFYSGPRRPLLAELVLDDNVEAIRRLYSRKRLSLSDIVPGAYEAVDELEFDGAPKTVYFLASRIYDGRGNVAGAVETLQDVTGHMKAQKQLQRYRQRLQSLASKLALAEERERRRMAQVLHDGVGQMLFAIKTKAGLVQVLEKDARRAALLGELLSMIDETIDRTRELTFELCPPLLYDMGLRRALDWLAEQFATRFGLKCRVSGELKKPLGDDTRGLAFQCVRELLMNVVKHAKAASASVGVDLGRDMLSVTVTDDGAGFDVAESMASSSRSGGFGLFSIRERLATIGGALDIESSPGCGTIATIRIPVARGPGAQEDTL